MSECGLPANVGSMEGLDRLAAQFGTLNFAFCGASIAMQDFADARRLYVMRFNRRRQPPQRCALGVRGRTRILKTRRDSQGYRAA